MESARETLMRYFILCAALLAACPAQAQERPEHKPKTFAGVVCTNAKAAKIFALLLRAEGDIARAFAASDKETYASCDPRRIAGRQVGASVIEVVPINGVVHRMQVTSVAAQGRTTFVIRCDRLKGLSAI